MALFEGRKYYIGRAVVSLTGTPDGSGTKAVVFDAAFTSTPEILVVGTDGNTGTATAASPTKTGFTVTVTSLVGVVGQDVGVYWVAFEKGIQV